MISLLRTNSDNPDFQNLVKLLDLYLAEKDGEEHDFYAQYNKLHKLKNVVVAYEEENPVACGAMKEYENGVMEIKRMYTLPESRGKGFAGKLLTELENWAKQLGYKKCILETGKRQTEAVQFYPNAGYKQIPNYGQYAEMENSLCFEKAI
ncbi:MAG: GNAT family N-acetyltransferase [Sphingobacteriales bacterium]|nr:MAG: GNAT family N-acetyltransferase [Sphingobacteriales bacterium]